MIMVIYPWAQQRITSKHVSPKHIHLDPKRPLAPRVSLLTQYNHPISRSQPPRLDLPPPGRAKFLPLRPSDPDDQNLFSRNPNFQLPPKLTILPTLTHSHILLVSTIIPLDSTTSSPAQSSPQRERRPSRCRTARPLPTPSQTYPRTRTYFQLLTKNKNKGRNHLLSPIPP